MISSTKKKGQSLVEFGLSLPLILLAIFLFLDMGRAVYYYSALTNAVREGARYSIVNKVENEDDKAVVRSIVANYSIAVPIDEAMVIVQPGGIDEKQVITVSAAFEFNPITPMLAQVLGVGNTITIHSSSTMLLTPLARGN